LELQCENLKNANMNLNAMQAENLRLHGVDEDLKRAHAEIFEGQEVQRRLQEKIQELEANMGRKIAELQQKDEAIRQIDVDVREM
jgi:uncharacterized protein (DUF3084 family)